MPRFMAVGARFWDVKVLEAFDRGLRVGRRAFGAGRVVKCDSVRRKRPAEGCRGISLSWCGLMVGWRQLVLRVGSEVVGHGPSGLAVECPALSSFVC